MKALIFLVLFAFSALLHANPFVGTWIFDAEATLREAKEGNFKGHDISKIVSETGYIDFTTGGSLIFFSVRKLTDGTANTIHFPWNLEGGVTEEFSRKNGSKPIDRFRTKKIDDYTYEIAAVRDPAQPEKPNDWKGLIWVSPDKKIQRVKLNNAYPTGEIFYKVYKRVD